MHHMIYNALICWWDAEATYFYCFASVNVICRVIKYLRVVDKLKENMFLWKSLGQCVTQRYSVGKIFTQLKMYVSYT